MRIRSVTLQPFRNFTQFSLSFEGGRTLIGGGNGRGKSNILEAVSYLSIGKSIRGTQDHQAVPHGGHHFDIRAVCCDGRRDHLLRLFYGIEEGKKAFCDGSPLPRVSDVLGIFKSVHFSPEDVALVLRFPAQRRRLLDILISQTSAPYLRDLQRYQRILAQRNHLLRTSQRFPQGPGSEGLQAWDTQLARLGARVRRRRLEAVGKLEGLVAAFYGRFCTHKETAALFYQGTQVPARGRLPGEEALEEELLEEMEQKRPLEVQQGHTRCGPHRDNLVFALDGQPADTFASEGQLKTLLISWKMAEACFLEQETGQQPVLLLDDVLSELDERRAGELLEMVDGFDQVLLTTPQRPDERLRGRFGEVWLDG